jgi:hypothetical protein
MKTQDFSLKTYNFTMGYEPSDKFGFYACHLSQKTDKVTPGLIGA